MPWHWFKERLKQTGLHMFSRCDTKKKTNQVLLMYHWLYYLLDTRWFDSQKTWNNEFFLISNKNSVAYNLRNIRIHWGEYKKKNKLEIFIGYFDGNSIVIKLWGVFSTYIRSLNTHNKIHWNKIVPINQMHRIESIQTKMMMIFGRDSVAFLLIANYYCFIKLFAAGDFNAQTKSEIPKTARSDVAWTLSFHTSSLEMKHKRAFLLHTCINTSEAAR